MTSNSALEMMRSLTYHLTMAGHSRCSATSVMALLSLAARPGQTQTELIGDIRESPNGTLATLVVDRLTELDLVERYGHPRDRRMNLLRLTQTGEVLVKAAVAKGTREERENMEAALSGLVSD